MKNNMLVASESRFDENDPKIKIDLNSVSKMYGALNVVNSISLSILDGEFVSLLGPSGCGKTTTLRMIAGFLPLTSGTIRMGGAVISDPNKVLAPEKRNMSMIFQSYAIWPHMTVGENVAFGLKIRKLGSKEINKRVDKMLEIVRLGHLKNRYPSELSGGQQQRVALARAIVIEPQVLLLDEPLSNLDASLRDEMRSEIRRLHNEFKITTIYVTHDQSEAMVASDRIVVMNQGVIEQIDDPVSLYNQPKTRFVASFIGQRNFFDGQANSTQVDFPGFSIPFDLIPGDVSPGERISCAVQQTDIKFMTPDQISSKTPQWTLGATVADRFYLGDCWVYVLEVNGGMSFKVTAKELIANNGNKVQVYIDKDKIVRIPPATT